MTSTTLREDFLQLAKFSTDFANLDGKNIYITGATGQIGWYLVRYLCHLITHSYVDCDLNAHVRTDNRLIQKFPDYAALPCTFHVLNNPSTPLLEKPYDLVIHCASLASPKHFIDTPVNVMIPNGIMTNDLLDALHKSNPNGQFVYLSTTGVTGHIPDHLRPSTENDFGPLSSTDLKNCYLESKRFGEMLTLAYAKQYGLRTLIIRPSITYGPGFELDDGRSYADFIKFLLQKQPIKLSSDGNAIRNFLYISDFVRGLLLSIQRAPANAVLNIASPHPISILELATLLNSLTYAQTLGPVEHQPVQNKMGRVEFRSTDASVEQLKSLGWEQLVLPLDGFRRTLQHYQEHAQCALPN